MVWVRVRVKVRIRIRGGNNRISTLSSKLPNHLLRGLTLPPGLGSSLRLGTLLRSALFNLSDD